MRALQSLYLKVEASAGSETLEVIEDLVALADRVGATVECSMNGVTVLARPGVSAANLFREFERQLQDAGPSKYRLASVRP